MWYIPQMYLKVFLLFRHLHNNRVKQIGDNCFAGLLNLETLWVRSRVAVHAFVNVTACLCLGSCPHGSPTYCCSSPPHTIVSTSSFNCSGINRAKYMMLIKSFLPLFTSSCYIAIRLRLSQIFRGQHLLSRSLGMNWNVSFPTCVWIYFISSVTSISIGCWLVKNWMFVTIKTHLLIIEIISFVECIFYSFDGSFC